MSLLDLLPPELLSHLLEYCDLPSLLSLSSTCSSLHAFLASSHFPLLARCHYNYAPTTLSHLGFHSRAPWTQRLLWADTVAANFSSRSFKGIPLGGPSRTWRKCLPAVKLWEPLAGLGGVGGGGEVLIARGRAMETWRADHNGTMRGADVVVEGFDTHSHQYQQQRGGRAVLEDVTALADGAKRGEVVAARVNGVVHRLRVVKDTRRPHGPGGAVVLRETARYDPSPPSAEGGKSGGKSTTVQALASSGGTLVCASTTRYRSTSAGGSGFSTPREANPSSSTPDLSSLSLAASLSSRAAPSAHSVSIHSLAAPWEAATHIPFQAKPWSVLLSPSFSSDSSSLPTWLVVGNTGRAPLSLVPLRPSGPLAPVTLAHTAKPTSVYALTTPSPSCSPFLHPTQTLVAAFYDSTTRIYDLRLPSPSSSSSFSDPPASRPSNEVLRLSDPWSDDPSYSVALSGPLGCSLAVGSARNAAVRLFDLRQPSHPTGLTAFAPGRHRSPVYGLAAEGSRVWGVTDQRGFGFDWEAFPGGEGEGVSYVSHEGGGGELRRTW
ncbi:hypothetical protein JCM8097_008053 [Rhodosporidiobolus ruineniae]